MMEYINIEALEDIARDFLVEEFGLDLEIPIVRNNRLKTSMGRFVSTVSRLTGVQTPYKIDIAGYLFEHDNPVDLVIGVLKHECVHYALLELGIPNRDSDQTFINACVEKGVPLTGTESAKRTRTHHIYHCDTCDEVHTTNTKPKWGYSCGKCKHDLRYVRKVTEIK